MLNAYFGVLILALVIYLQIFLSRMKNRWAGLILPILSFIYSLIIIFFILLKDNLIGIIMTFFITNIPTMLFFAIYVVIKKNMNTNS